MRLLLISIVLCFSSAAYAETKTAVFAGGCFWCMEKPYDEIEGVLRSTSGYTGGIKETATYEMTSTGKTAHYEAIEIEYDPDKVSYETLLDIFWKNIDPFDDKGQFCDKGPQYRAAVFPHNEQEKKLAEKSKQDLQAQFPEDKIIVTEILEAKEFYPAEEYHQDYYLKNPLRYKYYRYSCGRDNRLSAVKNLLNSTGKTIGK